MAISMLKIRRPLGRLIFNMGIAIPGKTVFLIETAPRMLYVWGQWVISVLRLNSHGQHGCLLSIRQYALALSILLVNKHDHEYVIVFWGPTLPFPGLHLMNTI